MRRPVLCNETGVEYPSSRAAAEDMGLASSNISMHINGHSKYRHVGGYTFTPIDRENETPKSSQLPRKGASKVRSIMCLNTKQVFISVSDAARKMSLSASSITQHLDGASSHTHVGGYYFIDVTLEFDF